MPVEPGTPPRAVFFDAGNTLLRMDYEAVAAEARRHGVPVTPAEVERAEWRARVRLDAEVLARAESSESRSTGDRYVGFLLEGLGVTREETVRALQSWRRGYNLPIGVWGVAAPAAAAALAAVRAAGLGAAVISNSDGTVRSILDGLGLTRYLDFVIDSSEVGVEKPHPRIFEIALARAGLRPHEAAYVGDLYSVDVVGARAAGIEPVLLDPGGCWGARDCRTARDLLAAVALVLGRRP